MRLRPTVLPLEERTPPAALAFVLAGPGFMLTETVQTVPRHHHRQAPAPVVRVQLDVGALHYQLFLLP